MDYYYKYQGYIELSIDIADEFKWSSIYKEEFIFIPTACDLSNDGPCLPLIAIDPLLSFSFYVLLLPLENILKMLPKL